MLDADRTELGVLMGRGDRDPLINARENSEDDEYDACQFNEYSFLMFNYSESMLPLQSECHPFDIGYLA